MTGARRQRNAIRDLDRRSIGQWAKAGDLPANVAAVRVMRSRDCTSDVIWSRRSRSSVGGSSSASGDERPSSCATSKSWSTSVPSMPDAREAHVEVAERCRVAPRQALAARQHDEDRRCAAGSIASVRRDHEPLPPRCASAPSRIRRTCVERVGVFRLLVGAPAEHARESHGNAGSMAWRRRDAFESQLEDVNRLDVADRAEPLARVAPNPLVQFARFLRWTARSRPWRSARARPSSQTPNV